MPVHEITSSDDLQTHLSASSPLTVLYFHAPWAAPCKQMSQALAAISNTYTAPPAPTFLSIDAEEQADIAESYSISSVPYLVFLDKDRRQVDAWGGVDARKLDATVKLLISGSGADATAGNAIPPAQSVNPGSNPTHDDEDDDEEEDLPLEERLEKLVSAAPVMVFIKGTPSAPQCGFSRQLITLLRERRVRFGFFNILADEEVRQGLKVFSDWPTYPQVYKNGQLVGGLDIVKEELEADPEFFKEDSVAAAPAA